LSFVPQTPIGDPPQTLLLQSSRTIFKARRNARIASVVLATAIPSVCPSVRLSVCLSHAGIVSKRLHVACAVCTVKKQNVSSFVETKNIPQG